MEPSPGRFEKAKKYFRSWYKTQQFSVRDFFWLVMLLSVCCAWWVHDRAWREAWFDRHTIANQERIELQHTADWLHKENASLRAQVEAERN
jgi:hypothetical protein